MPVAEAGQNVVMDGLVKLRKQAKKTIVITLALMIDGFVCISRLQTNAITC